MRLVLLILATFRLTLLLTWEDGPLDLFRRLRSLAEDRTRLLACPWCTSMWVSAALALLACHDFRTWLLGTLAGSGGAVLLLSAVSCLEESHGSG